MRYRFVPAIAALVLCVSGCSPTNSSSNPIPTAKPAACSTLVLTGHPAYPPVAWANGASLEGGGIQVVRRLARDNGVGISVVNEKSWENAQLAVRAGKADAIVGLYKTQQRLAYFNYVNPPLAPDPSSVLIRTGESFTYVNWNSLIGKRGVVGAGESYGSAFDAFRAAKLTTYNVATLADVYQQLLAGKADYGLSGYYATVTSAPKGIAIAAPAFVTEGLYLAFGKDNACGARLSSAFSREIAQLSADGTIKRIFAKALVEYEKTHPNTAPLP
jgi:polar amino acid transport system substrate-binding protein